MRFDRLDSYFLQYLIDNEIEPGSGLPTLADISEQLDVSVGKLREELGVARAMGLVTIKPRVGMRRADYRMMPALLQSVQFSMASEEGTFEQFSELRKSIELAFWDTAVARLTEEDVEKLRDLITSAWDKLNSKRIKIPHQEHRAFHLAIFGRIENPYVIGLLETYWAIYEAGEVTRYQTYKYWCDVWAYHERIVDAIAAGEVAAGRQLLQEHFDLLTTTIETVARDSM